MRRSNALFLALASTIVVSNFASATPSKWDQHFQARALDGHTIKLFTEGAETYAERLRMIESAQHSIYMTTYALYWDNIGINTLYKLCEKAQQGVDVRVLIDSWGGKKSLWNHRQEIRGCGVRLLFFNPAIWDWSDIMYALHDKSLMVDGRSLFMGGSNYGNHYYFGGRNSKSWHDIDARVDGPAACFYHAQFLETWTKSARKTEASRRDAMGMGGHSQHNQDFLYGLDELLPCSPVKQGTAKVLPLYSNPLFYKTRPLRDAYLKVINSAKSEIKVYSPYFVPDAHVSSALLAARKRGVTVKVLTNSRRSNDERASVVAAILKVNLNLVRAGVELYIWQEQAMMHRKGFVVDNEYVFFGSENFDRRGISYSSEAMAATDDAEVVKQFEAELDRDIGRSKQIDETTMRKELAQDYTRFQKWLAEWFKDYY